MIERNIHQRLQEYLDCYVDADLEDELHKLLSGVREPVEREDETEAALKTIAIAVLAGIERRAERISLLEGRISLVGAEWGLLATFPPHLLKASMDLVGQISGVGDGKKEGRISLGLRGGEVALSVERREEEGAGLVMGLPSF